MERESKEEDGLSTCSLFLKEEVSNCANHGDSASSSDSSVTALIVSNSFSGLEYGLRFSSYGNGEPFERAIAQLKLPQQLEHVW